MGRAVITKRDSVEMYSPFPSTLARRHRPTMSDVRVAFTVGLQETISQPWSLEEERDREVSAKWYDTERVLV